MVSYRYDLRPALLALALAATALGGAGPRLGRPEARTEETSVLMFVTYVPESFMWLPRMFGFAGERGLKRSIMERPMTAVGSK